MTSSHLTALPTPAERLALATFPVATQDLLASRVLQRRTDTKFAVTRTRLPALLLALCRSFDLVTAGEARVAQYQTVYFDTFDLRFFNDHVRGRRPRVKVRVRSYPDRELSFIEVKRKTARDETVKAREEREGPLSLHHRDEVFVGRHVSIPAPLVPSVRTDFRRITLVGREHEERITIDFGIEFGTHSARRCLPGLAIVELKQPRFRGRSPGALALRQGRARQVSFSKYCVGVALLHMCRHRRQALSRMRIAMRVAR